MTGIDVSTGLEQAADRLATASRTLVPCAPVRDLLTAGDVDLAYRVQTLNVARRCAAGRVRIGRKIGLTSPAVQQQLGVDQPDFGVLFDDMGVPSGGMVPAGRLLQPKAEGEIAFRLGADLDGPITESIVRDAVATAHAAIEIVDCRIAGWDISIVDTIADNASSGLFVVGDVGVPLTQITPADVEMWLHANGAVAATGSGAACLGDPLIALAWLARTAQRYGDPLRAGELVLSGALGPMITVNPGDEVRLEISGLGAVDVRFPRGAQ